MRMLTAMSVTIKNTFAAISHCLLSMYSPVFWFGGGGGGFEIVHPKILLTKNDPLSALRDASPKDP